MDALQALDQHRACVVVVGAQAIYLRTGRLEDIALAESTYDGDLAVDPRSLRAVPLLDDAMTAAGFRPGAQPGSWIGADGTAVDLMVPGVLSVQGGRRGARIPPHSKHAARQTPGLEAAIVDHAPMLITALQPDDDRHLNVNVASLAALLVAKLHKLADRLGDAREVKNKDAHDVYRILRAVATADLAAALQKLTSDSLAGDSTRIAIEALSNLFVDGSPPPRGADGRSGGGVGRRS